jgi:hypothetical protein
MSLAAVESFFDLHARKTTLATAPNYSSWIPRARRFKKAGAASFVVLASSRRVRRSSL